MREIKFRGKVLDEPNEWVYGYLDYENTIYQDKETENTKCCGIGIFKIDNETVGQYTGLKDKNRKEIYEGDIVQAIYYGKKVIGSINYWLGCFILENSCVSDNQLFVFDHVEVIGNIYDNPELIKED